MSDNTPQPTLDEILNRPSSIRLKEHKLSKALLEQGVSPAVYPALSEEAHLVIAQLIEAEKQKAIQEFCQDIQHKVDLSFKLCPPNWIVMPWEQTVRPIIYTKALGVELGREL